MENSEEIDEKQSPSHIKVDEICPMTSPLSPPGEMEDTFDFRALALKPNDVSLPLLTKSLNCPGLRLEDVKSPDTLAILAWDGTLTYGELDQISDRLASILALLGIGPECFVPICMEKSRWTTVAILAVLKSGGAFSLLDPSHPLPRLQSICSDLQCAFVLASESQATRCLQLGDVLIVEQLCQGWRLSHSSQPIQLAQPTNALYVAFTSGSTGKPKGVVIEHRAYCTGARFHTQAFQIDHKSRVLQFAAYAFDVSIMETLSALMVGSCLCVPSEAQRNDMGLFEDALKASRPTHAFLTPSFARTVSWAAVELRPTLILGGEGMRESDKAMYSALGIHLMNAYGPAECSVNATVNPRVQTDHPVQNIGKPTGAVAWIVDPDDVEKRMEDEMVGELLIEGPIVGRGYLNNHEATRKSFIKPPTWLQRLRRGEHQHRVYRTGDLASMDPSGVLRIVGRQDGQLKIRGQLIVDGIIAADGQEKLVVFIGPDQPLKTPKATGSPLTLFLEPNPSVIEHFETLKHQLHDHLPRYMVPDLWIPLARLPKTVSGKVDRCLLINTAAAISPEDLRTYTCSTAQKRPPDSPHEWTLQRIYADILDVAPVCIGMDDTFLRLGGDSLKAIRMVGAVRKAGLALSVQDILSPISLTEQAQKATAVAASTEEEQCDVQRSQVEDVYPCTSLQESMFATSLRRPGMYTGRIACRIPPAVNMDEFKEAWERTIENNAILRTRIIQTPYGLFQVVVRGTYLWREHLEPIQIQDLTDWVGKPLFQHSYHEKDSELILATHHAVWDDWTLHLVQQQLDTAFRGGSLVQRAFHPFIQHTQSSCAVEEFWGSELSGLEAPIFPELPSGNYRPSATQYFQHEISGLGVAKTTAASHTLPTYIYLAWALLVAHYTDSPDVVYGVTLSGRNAPVPDIESIVGPTITTIPLRIQFQPVTSVATALDQVQSTLTRTIPFQQAGLPRIAKSSPDAARGCQFQTQLIIQLPEQGNKSESVLEIVQGSTHVGMQYTSFTEYAMMLSCRPTADGTKVTIDATFDPEVISSNAVHRMMAQFEHILRQIIQHPAQQTDAVEMICPEDISQLQRWNSTIPPADTRCLHDLFLARCLDHPQATAVCAWDGELTYAELAELSSALAYRLSRQGVALDSPVGVCLERSKWSVVAILAVLRAGATCVLLDLNHPRQRIHNILQQASVQVVINSQTTTTLTRGFTPIEVCLTPEFTSTLSKGPYLAQLEVSPDKPAFILFTSGSTGRPKGIVMPHTSLASSIRHHSSAMKVGPDSRVFHFSSYAFDVSVYEIFTTLAAGASICIPSEFERKNALAQAICRFQANWAFLTPSTVQSLQPSEVPCLSTLVLGGEAVIRDNVEIWAPGRSLINGYGPAEATICGVGALPPVGWKVGVFGSIVGGVGWVTLPRDTSRLAAVGAIGELLLEGPFLAAGYFNHPEITAASFIECPEWRRRMPLALTSRLYRTGDLVQYQHDGTIRYIGRRDTRIKLRGQLVDLGEIESITVREFPEAREAAAEVLPLDVGGSMVPTLVAYIILHSTLPQGAEDNGILDPVGETFRQCTSECQMNLRALLPSYMVPSIFLPVRAMPRTVTGKLDRQALRSAIQSLTREQLQHYRAPPQPKIPVSSDAERQLQSMWAELLNMTTEDIGSEDQFLTIGGDSVIAMRMVAMARRAGFCFTVADALSPKSSLASLARNFQGLGSVEDVPPPAVQQTSILDSVGLQQHLAQQQQNGTLSFPTDKLASAWEATEAQSFLVHRYPWSHFQFPFVGKIDESRLSNACRALVRAHSVLRAAFVEYGKTLFHMTLEEDFDLPLRVMTTTEQPLEAFCQSLCQSDQATVSVFASIPTCFTLVSEPNRARHRLVLRLSHAQYDATSIDILARDLEALYNGQQSIAPSSFDSYFQQRTHHAEQAHHRALWQTYLAGSSVAPLTPGRTSRPQLHPITGSHAVTLPAPLLPRNIPLPTIVKAAACLVLARRLHQPQPDITVGQTVAGRSLPIPFIDGLVGCCTNYIPFRVLPRASMSGRTYLEHAQAQHVSSLQAECVDLRTIVDTATDWSPSASFPYILQHQTANHGLTLTLDGVQSGVLSSVGSLTPGPEVWICSTETPSGVRIDVHCCGQVMDLDGATRLAGEICEVISGLVSKPDVALSEIGGMAF
ncbi:hypothetical protein N7541_011086 [Penicillium brevicompactum]|uniref:Carrier domain-containing protein n=1 Tax=Penicillium brevicompactum TaxID=5074 RepID=A0A9W9UI95_PENBR|nr:hypothetical protein N7541_011086 [Penicillium brevicompactum]